MLLGRKELHNEVGVAAVSQGKFEPTRCVIYTEDYLHTTEIKN